jgi:hypothetical protein
MVFVTDPNENPELEAASATAGDLPGFGATRSRLLGQTQPPLLLVQLDVAAAQAT